jgi:hypothetical protein
LPWPPPTPTAGVWERGREWVQVGCECQRDAPTGALSCLPPAPLHCQVGGEHATPGAGVPDQAATHLGIKHGHHQQLGCRTRQQHTWASNTDTTSSWGLRTVTAPQAFSGWCAPYASTGMFSSSPGLARPVRMPDSSCARCSTARRISLQQRRRRGRGACAPRLAAPLLRPPGAGPPGQLVGHHPAH